MELPPGTKLRNADAGDDTRVTRSRSGFLRFLHRRDTKIMVALFPLLMLYPNYRIKRVQLDDDGRALESAEAAADATFLSLKQLAIIILVSAFVWLCFLKRDSVGRAVFYTLTGIWILGFWSLVVINSGSRAGYQAASNTITAIFSPSGDIYDLQRRSLNGEEVSIAAGMYATSERWERDVSRQSTAAARIIAIISPALRKRADTTHEFEAAFERFFSAGGIDASTLDSMDTLIERERLNAECLQIAARTPEEIRNYRQLLVDTVASEFSKPGQSRAANEFRVAIRSDSTWTMMIRNAELEFESYRLFEAMLRMLREHWDDWEFDAEENIVLWYGDDLLDKYNEIWERIDAVIAEQTEIEQRLLGVLN